MVEVCGDAKGTRAGHERHRVANIRGLTNVLCEPCREAKNESNRAYREADKAKTKTQAPGKVTPVWQFGARFINHNAPRLPDRAA